MKYLGYWPFAIAVIWATTAGIALIHYGAAPAVAWHITTGAVLLVAVAGSNARHVAREHQVADRLLMQLRPVAPIRPARAYIPRQTGMDRDTPDKWRRTG